MADQNATPVAAPAPAPAPTEPQDRREFIEQAFEAAEAAPAETPPVAATPTPTPAPPPQSTVAEPAQAPVAAPASNEQQGAGDEATRQQALPPEIERAPQSWRAPQRAKWDKLDPDIRLEISRRERETTRVLGETAQARNFAGQFQNAIQPFQARLASIGAHPIAAVHELFKTDYLLSTAPPAQRAALMARLITDYGVDVRELDAALASGAHGRPADPVTSQVDQLLQQRLAPFNEYIAQQQQREAQQNQLANQQVAQTIEQMAADPKYPYFEDLRQDMADIIDLASKRGNSLTLDQAYHRAAVMNPEIGKLVAAQRNQLAGRAAAQADNARAQRALNASSSVGGAPGGVPSSTPVGTDRRAALSAAFDAVQGR